MRINFRDDRFFIFIQLGKLKTLLKLTREFVLVPEIFQAALCRFKFYEPSWSDYYI